MIKINKKGQSLPLNTIVIALLVVIVLVVIVLAFTSNIGSANDTLNDNSVTNSCGLDNPAIALFNYDSVEVETKTNIPEDDVRNLKCEDGEEIRVVRTTEDGTTDGTKTVNLCCGIKE